MELRWSEDCIGGAYCHYGTVRGSALAKPSGEETGTPVKLEGGISGSFADKKCNAANTRCSDAIVSWTEGAHRYAVSLKDGKKDALVRMANSAIKAGRKETQP